MEAANVIGAKYKSRHAENLRTVVRLCGLGLGSQQSQQRSLESYGSWYMYVHVLG